MLSQFVAGLPAAEFDKAWSTYDADKAGSLREKQLLALTADLLGRVPNLFRVLLKRVHAKAPRPALDKMVRSVFQTRLLVLGCDSKGQ